MSAPIHVLHFADIHIGMENYGRTDESTGLSTRITDFLRRMDEMVDYARAQDVDLVVFAGDAFKTRTPNPTYQREFAHRIRDLSQLAPVVLLVGNHDLPPSNLKASSIEIYDTLGVPNVWVAADYDVKLVQTKRGAVIVGAAPYPVRSRMTAMIPETMNKTISEIDDVLRQGMSHIMHDLAVKAQALADEHDDDPPRLLTGHFTVTGAVWGSERSVMLGRDVEVNLAAVADPSWDYVALGHIHKHQNLTHGRHGLPPVVYSGSMERIDFGEAADPKGFCWVDLARGHTQWRYHPLEARPFVTLKRDLRNSTNPTEEVLHMIETHDLVGAVVRLNLQLTQESNARLNEAAVRETLKRANVHHVAAVKRDIDQPTRARLGGSPESMTAEQLLERYLASREVPAERQSTLMSAAQEIFLTMRDSSV
jgi:DNA repair protein SbcD/Mre11